MGDDLRLNFPFPAPSSDPQASATDLTRTNSDFFDSSVTVDCFRYPFSNAKPGQTMVWTNEKHNAYLDYLEASFIEQLHCSVSMHGCCQKIKYDRNDPLLDSTADSSSALGSPSFYHFTSSGKSSSETSSVPRETAVPNDGIYSRSNTNFSCKSANSDHHPTFYSFNQSLGGCTTEISDQNFVAEDKGEKASCVSGSKHLKMMTVVDASSNIQVVPHHKLHSVDESFISNASAKRRKKKTCQKSDICYFLRES